MKDDYFGYWKSFEDMISNWNFSHGEQETNTKKIFNYMNDMLHFFKKGHARLIFEGFVDNPMSEFSHLDALCNKDMKEIADYEPIDMRLMKEMPGEVPIYLLFRPLSLTVIKEKNILERRVLIINGARKPYFSREMHPEAIIGKIKRNVFANLHPFNSASQINEDSALILNFYEQNAPMIAYSKDAKFADQEKDSEAEKLLKRKQRHDMINLYIPPNRR